MPAACSVGTVVVGDGGCHAKKGVLLQTSSLILLLDALDKSATSTGASHDHCTPEIILKHVGLATSEATSGKESSISAAAARRNVDTMASRWNEIAAFDSFSHCYLFRFNTLFSWLDTGVDEDILGGSTLLGMPQEVFAAAVVADACDGTVTQRLRGAAGTTRTRGNDRTWHRRLNVEGTNVLRRGNLNGAVQEVPLWKL